MDNKIEDFIKHTLKSTLAVFRHLVFVWIFSFIANYWLLRWCGLNLWTLLGSFLICAFFWIIKPIRFPE